MRDDNDGSTRPTISQRADDVTYNLGASRTGPKKNTTKPKRAIDIKDSTNGNTEARLLRTYDLGNDVASELNDGYSRQDGILGCEHHSHTKKLLRPNSKMK